MAERRMFAKTIIDSDAFLDMPLSTQALYFHLSMRGDDEGFINNPKKIQRMIGASEDDLKLLALKNFIIPFESGIVVIKHWKIHNYIRGDRLQKTQYQDERQLLDVKDNGAYTLSENLNEIPQNDDVSQMSVSCQSDVSIGKDRIGEDRIGKDRIGKDRIDYQLIADMYNEICISFPRLTTLSEARKKGIKARLKQYSVDDFRTMFTKAEESSFLKGGNNRNWSATFDWMIKDTNMAKILDGNYDNKITPINKTAMELDNTYSMMVEWSKGHENEAI